MNEQARDSHESVRDPMTGRWVKGKSGNYKGGPRKERSVSRAIQEILDQHEFDGQTVEGGRKVAWKIATVLVRGALGGDIQFIKEVMDRTEGKPIQTVAVQSDDMATMQQRMVEYEAAVRNGNGEA